MTGTSRSSGTATASAARRKSPGAAHIRYVGFEHQGNKRAYLFEELAPGTGRRTFTVDADLALFTRHHVGMQEGPGLCLHRLEEELDTAEEEVQTSFRCSLTDRELVAYLASRPIQQAKHGSKRFAASSGAAT